MPKSYDLNCGTIVDVESPPQLSSRYEVYRQPHNEPNLNKHELKYTTDSVTAAELKIKKLKHKDTISDIGIFMRQLKKNPATVISGDIYPAKYYYRRIGEPIYVIVKSWRRWDSDVFDYVTETSRQIHYNYDVAIASLDTIRQQITKHNLKMVAELKMLTGVTYPGETESITMTPGCFDALCSALRNRGFNINADTNTILIPNIPSHELVELGEFRDRFIREWNSGESRMPPQELIDKIASIGLPFILTNNGINAPDYATDKQKTFLSIILKAFNASGLAKIIRFIDETLEMSALCCDLAPVNFTACGHPAPVFIRRSVDEILELSVETMIAHARTNENLRMLRAYECGLSFLRRENDSYAKLERAIKLIAPYATITRTTNCIKVVNAVEHRSAIRKLISKYNKDRMRAFMPITRSENNNYHHAIINMIKKAHAAGIPCDAVEMPDRIVVQPGADATQDQCRQLSQMVRDIEATGCDVDRIKNTHKHTQAEQIIKRRVLVKLCEQLSEIGLILSIYNTDRGAELIIPPMFPPDVRARIEMLRMLILKEEIDRIKKCERDEYNAMMTQITAAGIEIMNDQCPDECVIKLRDDAPPEHVELVRRLTSAYRRRYETGFEE